MKTNGLLLLNILVNASRWEFINSIIVIILCSISCPLVFISVELEKLCQFVDFETLEQNISRELVVIVSVHTSILHSFCRCSCDLRFYINIFIYFSSGPGPDSLPGPRCQWRYDSCVSPCFKTCSDPTAEACVTIPQWDLWPLVSMGHRSGLF